MITPENTQPNLDEIPEVNDAGADGGGYDSAEEAEAARLMYSVNENSSGKPSDKEALRNSYNESINLLVGKITEDTVNAEQVARAILRYVGDSMLGPSDIYLSTEKTDSLKSAASDFPGGNMSDLYYYLDKKFNQEMPEPVRESFESEEDPVEERFSDEDFDEVATIKGHLDRRETA